MTFLKNNLAVFKIGINVFFAVIGGYFLIIGNVFKTNPWYVLIAYSIISFVFLMLLWLLVRIASRKIHAAVKGTPGAIKKVPGKLRSKHQTVPKKKTVKKSTPKNSNNKKKSPTRKGKK